MFSERERQVIGFIRRKKKTLTEISKELFRYGSKPFDPTIAVANSVGRIIKKCEYHKLNWTLSKSRENKKLYIKKEKRG